MLGTGVFTFVQTDIRNNIAVRNLSPRRMKCCSEMKVWGIKGVRQRYESNHDISDTLENLVRGEQKDEHVSQKYATACLVRLVR